MQAQLKEDLKSPWLRGVLAVVGVTLIVNIGYIIYAFWQPPGLVVQNYYDKGKEYFHAEAVREQNAQTAWRLQFLPPATPEQGKVQSYRLFVVDENNQPVMQGKARLLAYRPSDASQDFQRDLAFVDAGTYVGQLRFDQPGHWDVIVQIEANGRKFDVAQKIFVADGKQ